MKSASQCRNMTGHMTPQQAAKRAKVGRTTIMRALEREELKAHRDNKGRWKISPEALEDWLSMRPVRSDDGQQPQTETNTNHDQLLTDAKIQIARLEAEKNGLEARLADTQAERDRFAEALEKSLEMRSVGFWGRLFSR